ncbi:PMD domain-containing protein, partial [Cephalotus follicularis]
WSHSHSCFHFPWGPMTVTLLDITSLTSLPILGEEVLAALPLSKKDFDFDPIGTVKCSYNSYMKKCFRPNVPVSDQEHYSFLLILLSKFLLCILTLQVSREFIPLAVV